MITECFNPSCRRKLDYLRDGRVVRVTRNEGEWVSIEHFWLCGSCYLNYDFEFLPDGGITLVSRKLPSSETSPVHGQALAS